MGTACEIFECIFIFQILFTNIKVKTPTCKKFIKIPYNHSTCILKIKMLSIFKKLHLSKEIEALLKKSCISNIFRKYLKVFEIKVYTVSLYF